MRAASTPGVVANLSRKNGAVRDARKIGALERAAELLGHTTLAEALDMSTRLLRQKIAAERPIHDAELSIAARLVSIRAAQAEELAARLTSLAAAQAHA